METLTNEIGFNNAAPMIDCFRIRVNAMLRDAGITSSWMYESESFTGYSCYLNTVNGKIRVSDHGRPVKAAIYADLFRSVVICDHHDKVDSEMKLNELFSFISDNVNSLFQK